ncbi:MAG: universal stress protein [Acidobacteria bacterium]|nr:universal stress protein [Acidobacteriota bacterium]
MFTRILVPTDFSAPSDGALEHARGLAAAFGGMVHLLHVLPNVFLRPVVDDPRGLETAAEEQLEERLTADERRRFLVLVALARSDEPADEIVRYARMHDMDAIVMGTHGRSGMSHALMGSIAEKVMRTAPCPVLTARAAGSGAGRGFKHVLVPTDFSEHSDAALDCARHVAARFGASLHLLHVLDDRVISGSAGSELVVAESSEVRAARATDVEERLADRLDEGDRITLRATTGVLFGAPAPSIASYAAGYGFDLIVMGTHGRTGLAHLLMGSVAEHVVRSATCPVITVKHAPVRAEARLPTPARAIA